MRPPAPVTFQAPTQYDLPPTAEEVLDARTAHTKLYQVDRWARASVFGHDMHYQEEGGHGPWIEVLLGNCFAPDGPGRARLVRVKQGGSFHGKTAELFERQSGKGIRFYTETPIGPPVSGTRIEHTKDGIPFAHDVTKGGMKMSGLVDRRLGPHTWTFDYELTGGMEALRQDAAGNLVNDTLTITRATVVDALGLSYAVPAWELLPHGQIAFDFDDTVIPPQNLPYTIDPTTVFNVLASGDDGFIQKVGQPYSSVAGLTGTLTMNSWNACSRSPFGGSGDFVIAVSFARWNTSSIGGAIIVQSATLRYWPQGQSSGLLGGLGPRYWESYNQQSAYSLADWTDDPVGPILLTDTTSVGEGAYRTITLNMSGSDVRTGGYTGIRLVMGKPVEPPVGVNAHTYAGFDDVSVDEPRLTLTYIPSRRIGRVHG